MTESHCSPVQIKLVYFDVLMQLMTGELSHFSLTNCMCIFNCDKLLTTIVWKSKLQSSGLSLCKF